MLTNSLSKLERNCTLHFPRLHLHSQVSCMTFKLPPLNSKKADSAENIAFIFAMHELPKFINGCFDISFN